MKTKVNYHSTGENNKNTKAGLVQERKRLLAQIKWGEQGGEIRRANGQCISPPDPLLH